MKLSERSAALT